MMVQNTASTTSCGRRTIPQTIDEIAKSERRDKTWARYPPSAEAFERGEFRTVSFALLANAINRLAWQLHALFAGHDDLESICYIGSSDIRYFILACAALLNPTQALFSSPRNDHQSHISLLSKTSTRVVLGPQEKPQDKTTQALSQELDLRYETILSLDELLDPQNVDDFPWNRTFEEVAHEPFVVLHTSGSTGVPKPVSISHGLLATIDAQQDLPDIDGRSVTAREWANSKVYTALPPFHSAGINFFSYSVFQLTELVFGPADKPPSIGTVEQMLDMRTADSAVLPPSLLAEVATDQPVLEKVSRWSSVTFGGGPLAQDAGDALWDKTKVLQILGSTETFNLPELIPREIDEWEYHSYHPSLGIEFRPHPEELSELVFVRDDSALQHQGAFWTFPQENEYSMKDLYSRHPSKPGLWKYRGRLDDVIVLSNGEKFNPTGAEGIMARDPAVKSALIVGASREQPAVLVEPSDVDPDMEAEKRRASVTHAVLQVLDEVNDVLPAHAQIHSSHVRVLDSSDTFLRSSKGEIRRKPTTDALSGLVSDVYLSADRDGSARSSGLDLGSSVPALTESLRELLSADFLKSANVRDDDNVFELGFDSLQAIKLLRLFRNSLLSQGSDEGAKALSPRAVYQHPTPRTMAELLLKSVHGETLHQEDDDAKSREDMKRTLARFTNELDSQLEEKAAIEAAPARDVVVLTGSTGSLGSYILDSLIRSPMVNKVVCLNRARGTAEKQAALNQSRGLSEDFADVEFVEADLTKRQLGLCSERYNTLLQEATHIIHNAWPVDFNLPLSSFEPQLQGCCQLLKMANLSRHRVAVTFLSSVGAANDWTRSHDEEAVVPETLLQDLSLSESMGYAQSKQISEILFAYAGQHYDMNVTVCRLGQIAGPVKSDKGMWNSKEWFPSIMASSKTLGKVPESLGCMDCMDWIPVDLLGDILVDTIVSNRNDQVDVEGPYDDDSRSIPTGSTSTSRSASPPTIFDRNSEGKWSSTTSLSSEASESRASFLHFVNPHKAHWRDMVHSLIRRGGDSSVSVVPYKEWLDALVEYAEREDTEDAAATNVPAMKLLSFFREIGQPDARRPEFSTAMAQKRSGLLKDLDPVSLEWVRRWIDQWSLDL